MGDQTQQVDASAWPLVVMKPAPIGTKNSLEELTGGLMSLLERRERFCVLGNFIDKTSMDLDEVKHLRDFREAQSDNLDTYVAALALVVPSAMVRGAIKLVFQPRSPLHPYSVFRNHCEARVYIRPYVAKLAKPSRRGSLDRRLARQSMRGPRVVAGGPVSGV